jgi:hypothetical protein
MTTRKGLSTFGGLDGSFCPIQQASDVADALVDGLGPDTEQASDSHLGQSEPIVEDGGQEPVGEGEDGAAAGSGADPPGPVAASFVHLGRLAGRRAGR